MPANRVLAQPRAPATARAILEDVGLGVAALHTDSEPGYGGVPQDAFFARRVPALERLHSVS
jgi:hypothetical protein